MPSNRTTLGRVAALAVGATALFSLAGPASAKEATGNTVSFSTIPTTVPPACQAVQSLKAVGDTRIGEVAVGTVSVDYSVKPCDSKEVVTVEALVYQSFVPSNVIYDDTAAPLDGRFGVGVPYNTTFKVAIIVRDAGTGVEVSRQVISAAATTRTTA